MISPEKHLSYALGFLELGLVAEAKAELSELSPEALSTPAAAAVLLEVAMVENDWEAVLPLAERLVGHDAKQERPWIAWAYALRELQRVQEAQEVLLAGRRLIANPSPLVDYNLACYACLLGDMDEARALLSDVISRDNSWRAVARTDPDLAALFKAQ